MVLIYTVNEIYLFLLDLKCVGFATTVRDRSDTCCDIEMVLLKTLMSRRL